MNGGYKRDYREETKRLQNAIWGYARSFFSEIGHKSFQPKFN